MTPENAKGGAGNAANQSRTITENDNLAWKIRQHDDLHAIEPIGAIVERVMRRLRRQQGGR